MYILKDNVISYLFPYRAGNIFACCICATLPVAGEQQELLAEQPEQKGKDNADQYARGEGKVEGDVLPPDNDVSGQPADPAYLVEQEEQKPHAGQNQPGDQKDFPQGRHR